MAKTPELTKEFKSSEPIADLPGVEKGILGVKAPASFRQNDDIVDRLRAAGILRGTVQEYIQK